MTSKSGEDGGELRQVCLFCLEIFGGNENGVGVVVRETGEFFKQFVRFARSFLKVDNLEGLLGDLDNDVTGGTLEHGPLFCEECHGVLERTLEEYKRFEDVRWRLMGKVVRLGGRIKLFGRKRSSYMVERHKEQLKSLAERLNVRRHCHLKVELFRKQLATKCDLKARGILPQVVLNRADTHLSRNHETGTGCISKVLAVPSREVIRAFGSVMIIFTCAYGWDLEKIMEHYRASSSSDNQQLIKQISQPIAIKRRPGRPPKNHHTKVPASRSTSPPAPQIKRRPGRPPWKHLTISKNLTAPPPTLPQGQPVKRRPGRPPWKHLVKKNVAAHPPQTKRGPCGIKRRRGRPKTTNLKAFTNSEAPGVGSPKRIKLEEAPLPPLEEAQGTDNAAAEKIEVDIPSPEPSMVADAYDDDPASFDDDLPVYEDNTQLTKNLYVELDFPKQEVEIPSNLVKENGRRKLRPRSESQLTKMVEADAEPERQDQIAVKPATRRKRGRPHGSIGRRKKLQKAELENKTVPVDDFSHGFSISCPDCSSKFSKLFPFNDHLQKEHGAKEPETCSCTICDKEFDNTHSLYLHLQENHEVSSNNKPHTCVYCPATFTTSQMSILHRRNAHWIFSQELHCDLDQCPEKFLNPPDLQRHHESHLLGVEGQEQVYSCETCGWSFLNSSRLSLHKFNHYEANAVGHYQCPQCPTEFRSHFLLASHFYKFHCDYKAESRRLGQPQELLYCDLDKNCQFYFFNQRELDAHKEIHAKYQKVTSGLQDSGSVGYPFYCLYCRKEFLERCSRDGHEKECPNAAASHEIYGATSGGKKYVCGKCEFATDIRRAMERHQSRHLEPHHRCPRCDKRFHQRSYLEWHKKDGCEQDPPKRFQLQSLPRKCAKIVTRKNNLYSDDLQAFVLKCPKCSEQFKTLFPFKKHLQKKHGSKKNLNLICTVCNKQCDSSCDLLSHLQDNHEGPADDKPYYCVYCSRSFASGQTCDLHRKNDHWIYPQELTCDFDDDCPEKFFDTRDLRDHHRSHLGPDGNQEDLFSCDKCQLSFFRADRLQLHKVNHVERSEPDSAYLCGACDQGFSSVKPFVKHYNNVHRKNSHVLYCRKSVNHKTCPLYFFNVKQLNDHYDIAHKLYGAKVPAKKRVCKKPEVRQVYYFCLYCKLKFDDMNQRDSHENDQCPERPSLEKRQAASRRFVCSKCDVSLDNRIHLERHQRQVHGGEFRYQCSHCGRRFQRNDNLEAHIQALHERTNEFVCHVCGAVRTSQTQMTFHLKEHESSHLCSVCGKKCTRAWLLKIHMRSHTGERMMCEWCPRILRTVAEVKRHAMEMHEDELEKNYGYDRSGVLRGRIKYRLVKLEDVDKRCKGNGANGDKLGG